MEEKTIIKISSKITDRLGIIMDELNDVSGMGWTMDFFIQDILYKYTEGYEKKTRKKINTQGGGWDNIVEKALSLVNKDVIIKMCGDKIFEKPGFDIAANGYWKDKRNERAGDFVQLIGEKESTLRSREQAAKYIISIAEGMNNYKQEKTDEETSE